LLAEPAPLGAPEPPIAIPPQAVPEPARLATPDATAPAPMAAKPEPPARATLPAAPPAAVANPSPRAATSPAMLDMLQRRGDEMLATGDVSAARRLYERGVAARSARAAFALARTYDPRILATLGVKGLAGDPEVAIRLYRHAIDLGSTEARPALDRLLAMTPDELARLR
jgi:TPR repeat protein